MTDVVGNVGGTAVVLSSQSFGFGTFYFWRRIMKELSVFVDESGDFGEYSFHAPFYIVTMVFHNQEIEIESKIKKHFLTSIFLKNLKQVLFY